MSKSLIIPDEIVTGKIFLVRGKKVMLDDDLAQLYRVQTRRLNEQVQRNKVRFPLDFMFQLSAVEWENLMSQIATSSWGGRRKLPFAFTEHGVLMLSSVLNSRRAIQVNIQIMRIFAPMCELALTSQDILLKLDSLEQRVTKHDEDISVVFKCLRELLSPGNSTNQKIGFRRKGET